jgi:hypothetical protein
VQREQGGGPVGERALGDRGGHGVVARRGEERVPAAEGGAPQDDPRAIEILARADVVQGGPPVLELAVDVEQLPRLAGARSEVAVVEDQARVAGGLEALRVGVESHLLDGAESVRHDEHRVRRLAGGRVEPRGAGVVSRGEGNVRSGRWVGGRHGWAR